MKKLIKRMFPRRRSILNHLSINEQELTTLIQENPSLRGIFLGYVAEHHFQKELNKIPGVHKSIKDDDHDRKKKGDRRIIYKGKEIVIEVKSIQSNSIKYNKKKGVWQGKAQVDASDSRYVTFPDGSRIRTTCLRRGEFDILAVNLFPFVQEWRFAYIRNEDIPQNTYKKYTDHQREHLLPTTVKVDFPLKGDFFYSLEDLLDTHIRDF